MNSRHESLILLSTHNSKAECLVKRIKNIVKETAALVYTTNMFYTIRFILQLNTILKSP